MKKIMLTACVIALATTTACMAENNLWNNIQKDFSNATKTIQNDVKNVNSQTSRGSGAARTLQGDIDELKAQKEKELQPIKKQIADKEAQMRKVLMDTKLSATQKKSKTTLLQKEISTLKTQKENIEEKYRQKIREFRNY